MNKYSNEFIAEVKEIYPESTDMHKLAEENNHFLGRYLDDSSTGNIPVDTILLAVSLEELQVKARMEKRRTTLYSKWYKETRGWN